MKKRKIIWQLWKEPFIEYEDSHYDGDTITKPYLLQKTNYGLIGIKPHAEINSDFVFWVGNCTFDLGEKEKEILEDVEGIESLDFFGPYRFRFSAGIAFKSESVKRDIERQLIGNIPIKLSAEIKKAIIDCKYSGKNWLIFTTDGDRYESFLSDNDKEFQDTLSKFMNAKKYIVSHLIKGYK